MPARTLILLIDGDTIHEWQRRAIEMLPLSDRIAVFSCTNTRLKRHLGKYWLYYGLNMVAVRNPLTRRVAVGDLGGRITSFQSFESEWDGNWQKLPQHVEQSMIAIGAIAVVKFGLGLMRVPDSLKIPILSYHHGDPDHYRGRPAGFYEMTDNAPRIGQIVQSISNKLDAGEVLAFAETRVIPHSWRKTLVEAFRHSPYLLPQALYNVERGIVINKSRNGRNYRLPSNSLVAAHIARTAGASLRRLAYGLLAEKQWHVSTVDIAGVEDAIALASGALSFPDMGTWHNQPPIAGYSFLADPFFAPDGSLLVEAMPERTGRGELLHIGQNGPRTISQSPGHHSYPGVVHEKGVAYCVPEIADWSSPLAYRIVNGADSEIRLCEPKALSLPENLRLTDPTFFWRNDRLWLFGNSKAEGSNVLRFWSATGLFDEFVEHPESPVRISPEGARMAGAVLSYEDRLYRVGQRFDRDYGNGVSLFEIKVLTEEHYEEAKLGSLMFEGCKGPHSFNLAPDGSKIAFDWYLERITPMAGFRRLRSRLKI